MKKLIILFVILITVGCKSFPVVPIKFNIENDSHQALAFNLAVKLLESKGYPIGDNISFGYREHGDQSC